MFLGVISWMVCSIFVLALAWCLGRLLRTGRSSIDVLAFVFLSVFVITFFLLVMGLIGRLLPLDLLVVALAGEGLLAAIPATRRELASIPRALQAGNGLLSDWWRGLPGPLRIFSLAAIALSAVRFGFLIWALPPFVWDSLAYHLTNVAHWTQQGRIELFSTPVTRIYNPANFEVLASWFTVFLHHDVVVEAAGLPAYLMCILAVYSLARSLGISRSGAWIGAMAYGATPALLLATTGTKNDPHIAAYYLTGMALACDLVMRRTERRPHGSLGEMVLLALVLLLALGTKAYILHLTLGILLVWVAFAWASRRQTDGMPALRHLLQEIRTSTLATRWLLAGLVAAGLFLGMFWNVRNYRLTGNPFYPYGVSLAGSPALGAGERETELSFGRLVENLQDLAYKFGDRQERIGPDLTNTTGWGWFAYGLGLPALLWALVRRPKLRILTAGFVLSLLLLFLSDRPSPWSMRYAIWFPAVLAVAFGALVDFFRLAPSLPRRILWLVLAALLGLNFLATANYGIIRLDRIAYMLTIPTLSRDAAAFRINMPVEYERALSIVPRDALLGYNVHSNGFVYPLFRADYSQRITYIPVSPEETCEQVGRRMEEAGTRYLFVAPEHTRDEVIAFLRQCAAGDTPIRERARGLYVFKPSVTTVP